MRLIPPVIGSDHGSSGERRIFASLQASKFPDSWFCLHSLTLTRHPHKRQAEVDFVLVGPDGIFCLEIKGGRFSVKNGRWRYQDGFADETPFQQVNSAMHAMIGMLASDRFQLDFEPKHILHGFGVIFTDQVFAQRSIEWDLETVLDAEAYHAAESRIDAYLRRLIAHWQKQTRGTGLSHARTLNVLKCLRPEFEQYKPLRSGMDFVESTLVRLTEQQYEKLDSIDRNRRIICSGGAGTGKTFLAKINAEHHAARGQKVLFLCFNPVLASYLRSQIKTDGILVSSIHEYLVSQLPAGHDFSGIPSSHDLQSRKYLEELPSAFVEVSASYGGKPEHDVIIIDEAQDCLSMPYLEALDFMVKGGLEKGIWRLFLDVENQRNVQGVFEQEALSMLELMDPVWCELSENCRNTQPIVTRTKLMTGLDFCSAPPVEGEQVDFRYVEEPRTMGDEVLKAVRDLLKLGLLPGEITVLVEGNIAAAVLQSDSVELHPLLRESASVFPFHGVTISSVADFKGLENRAIILADLMESEDDVLRYRWYVAMTRGRQRLIVIIPDSMQTRIKTLISENALLLAKEYE